MQWTVFSLDVLILVNGLMHHSQSLVLGLFCEVLKTLSDRTSHLLLFVQKRNGENSDHSCATENVEKCLHHDFHMVGEHFL